MSYKGYVCQIKNLRNHPNGDRLYLGECFGNTVAVSREGYTADMLGVYFPSDGQLSVEFCQHNNLLRLRGENGNQVPGSGYMDPDKRNVKAIKLRGEKSDGLFLPLTCLDYCFEDGAVNNLNLGDTIDVVNGHEICKKYIPRGTRHRTNAVGGNKTRKHKAPIAPLFMEHADTEQLAYNLGAFKPGDNVEITLKMHGTSQRTGYLPVLSGYKRTFWDKLFRRDGQPIYNYDIVTGTRRTVIEGEEGGYYGSNKFRLDHSEKFRDKLWKGETVYYEVVGFTHDGLPIMSECNNKKLNDKEFVKKYGEKTIFSYGCAPETVLPMVKAPEMVVVEPGKPQSDIYVYRMTMTNEDGNVVEYTPDFMRYRCEQMGVKTVPVMTNFILHDYELETDERSAGEIVKDVAERYCEGPDPIGKTHIREGVVARIINRPKFTAYKHKNHSFKMISGIITESVADEKTNISDDILEEL